MQKLQNISDDGLTKYATRTDGISAKPHMLASPEWRWPHFTPLEMACRHCDETYDWPHFMDRLQLARNAVGRSFHILSAHRCALHNARIGGAPFSEHLRLAADISLYGHDHRTLKLACENAGFTGFGFYQTFLHIDLGRPRFWYGGQKAKILWQTL